MTPTPPRRLVLLVVTGLAAALVATFVLPPPPPARAGDRRAEVLFVDVTPVAASTPPARACAREIQARLAADYTTITTLTAAAFYQRVGRTAADPFVAWPAAALDRARERGPDDVFDTIVLVDCRPEARRLDVVVAPPAPGVAVIQLRHLTIDRTTAAWVTGAILRRAWIDFSP